LGFGAIRFIIVTVKRVVGIRFPLRRLVITGGTNLRMARERLGLSMREVESASVRIAERHGNDEFTMNLSRLSDIETKGVVPSIFRLYTLGVIYRLELSEILSWYGINLGDIARDVSLMLPPKSHRAEVLASASSVQIPKQNKPGKNRGKPGEAPTVQAKRQGWGDDPVERVS
jgi:transcriptional regulator with XRE-family HTH domain